jgi:hypothetical protein
VSNEVGYKKLLGRFCPHPTTASSKLPPTTPPGTASQIFQKINKKIPVCKYHKLPLGQLQQWIIITKIIKNIQKKEERHDDSPWSWHMLEQEANIATNVESVGDVSFCTSIAFCASKPVALCIALVAAISALN